MSEEGTILRGIPNDQVIEVGTIWQEALIHLFWIMHSAEVDDSTDGKKAFQRAEDYDVCADVVDGIFEMLDQNGDQMKERLHTQLLHLAQIHATETGMDSGAAYSAENIAEDAVREGTEAGGLSMQYALQMFTSMTAERIITQIQLEMQEHHGIETILGELMQGMAEERGN